MDVHGQRDAAKVLIQRYYDAFNRQDMAGFLEMLSDDVIHDANQGGRNVGKVAFAAFMSKMNRLYRERITDLVIMTNEDGSRASAEFVVAGAYLATDEGLPQARGQQYSLPAGTFFDIGAEGKIKRVTTYYNLQDWLAQVR